MPQTLLSEAGRGVTEANHNREAFDVVLPAGGRIGGLFAERAGVEVKALLRFGGETILARSLRVLRETGRVGNVVVVGPHEAGLEALEHGADGVVGEAETGPDNILAGLRALAERPEACERVLILTTDLPFVTRAGLCDFLDRAGPDADIAVPAVTRAALEAKYPGLPNTYVGLADGEYTVGGAFVLRPLALERNRAHLDRAFASRKSNLAMARLLGPRFLLKYLTRRLTISDIEARCRSVLNCAGAAVRDAAPELAFDIDLPEEYDYALTLRKPEDAL